MIVQNMKKMSTSLTNIGENKEQTGTIHSPFGFYCIEELLISLKKKTQIT